MLAARMVPGEAAGAWEVVRGRGLGGGGGVDVCVDFLVPALGAIGDLGRG